MIAEARVYCLLKKSATILLLCVAALSRPAGAVNLEGLNVPADRVPDWYAFDESVYQAAKTWPEFDVTCASAPCPSGKQPFRAALGLSRCSAVSTGAAAQTLAPRQTINAESALTTRFGMNVIHQYRQTRRNFLLPDASINLAHTFVDNPTFGVQQETFGCAVNAKLDAEGSIEVLHGELVRITVVRQPFERESSVVFVVHPDYAQLAYRPNVHEFIVFGFARWAPRSPDVHQHRCAQERVAIDERAGITEQRYRELRKSLAEQR